MASALPDHGVVVDLCEDVAKRRARALRHDHAGLEPQLGLRRFEHAGGRSEELLARVPRGEAHGGPDRRYGERSRGDGTVGIVGVAEPDLHVVELDAELVGADLREHRARPGPDVLRSGREDDGAVGIEMDRGIRRRATAAAPDLRGHPEPAPAMWRRAAKTSAPAALPADLRGAD